jgi:CRISPR-associated protein Cmr4
MTNSSRTYWIHAVSSLHVGSGRGVGYIDLPVVREKTTNWPFIPGTGIKGVVSDYYNASGEGGRKDRIKRIAFGAADDSNIDSGSNAGALVFTDARLVCLPVRSFYGTFAWCTCPLALARFSQDLSMSSVNVDLEVPGVDEAGKGLLPKGSELIQEGNVYIEDLDIKAHNDEKAEKWAAFISEQVFLDSAWQEIFRKHFLILSDDVFNFLCQTGTEVSARIKIHPEKGTTEKGQLWYEESLPAETILFGLVWCDKPRYGDGEKVSREFMLSEFCKGEHFLQMGGNATTGKGRVRMVYSGGEKA